MRNFIEQFKYQFKNYFDTDSEIAAGDQWDYIKLNLLLTILPVINFCLLFLLSHHLQHFYPNILL